MHAAIAGASVAGLATACSLVERGWSVDVLERRPDLLEGGRAILLQPNGLSALERLGALDGVLERGTVVPRVSFYLRGKLLARVDFRELRHPHPYALEIRPQELRPALADRLGELGGGSPRLGCELTSLVHRGDAVTGARFRDREGREQELEADLVVGADGPDSTVRAALGIACRYLAAPESYLLGTVDVDTEREELAVYCGPGYADGVVPLPDGTYFWDRVTRENREAVRARDVRAWREVFEGRVAGGPGLAAAVRSWDQLTVVEVRPFWAKRRIGEGVALAGDAAGAVHPHGAQGANLALEDSVALGHAVAEATSPGPVSRELLQPYSRQRHRRLRRFVLWSLISARSYDAPSPIWRPQRRIGFAVNRLGPVRRGLLRLTYGGEAA